MNSHPIRYASVCSGIEAATVAWHPLGWEPAFFAEIEPFCCSLLKHHYPSVPNLGDFTQIGAEHGPVDLLVGGTPCQDFSVAGKRAGLDGYRGSLSLRFIELAERLQARWIVWENVPGVLSSGRGRDFGAFLGALAERGYHCSYRVLDAQYFGVPQRRRRVFVVGYLGDWRPPAAVLFEPDCLPGNPSPRRGEEPPVAALTANGVGTCGADDTQGSLAPGRGGRTVPGCRPQCVTGDVTHTLRAEGFGNDGLPPAGSVLAGVEALGAREAYAFGENQRAEVLLKDVVSNISHGGGKPGQGYPAVIQAVASCLDASGHDTTRANMASLANLVPVAFGGNRQSGPTDVATACNAKGGSTSRVSVSKSIRPEPPLACGEIAFHLKQDPISGEVSPALGRTSDGMGVLHPALALTERTRDGLRQLEYQEEVAYCLDNPGAGGRAQTRNVFHHYRVRRLTPKECERLQGFPDSYTLIPHGKQRKSGDFLEWLAYQGGPWSQYLIEEARKLAADGPRYRAIGNSMAVPCMRWIGERIAYVDALLRGAP